MQDHGLSSQPSFLHLLAHDLRTPLGGLSAALDVMSYGSQLPAADVAEALSVAKRQVGRLSQTIEILEILDLLGRPGLEPVAVRLDRMLEKAWDRARVQGGLSPRPLACAACSVGADSEMLLHLLHALLRHGLSLHPADLPRLAIGAGSATVLFAAPDAAPPVTERLPLMLRAAQALAAFLGGDLVFHGHQEAPGFRLRLKKCSETDIYRPPPTPALGL